MESIERHHRVRLGQYFKIAIASLGIIAVAVIAACAHVILKTNGVKHTLRILDIPELYSLATNAEADWCKLCIVDECKNNELNIISSQWSFSQNDIETILSAIGLTVSKQVEVGVIHWMSCRADMSYWEQADNPKRYIWFQRGSAQQVDSFKRTITMCGYLNKHSEQYIAFGTNCVAIADNPEYMNYIEKLNDISLRAGNRTIIQYHALRYSDGTIDDLYDLVAKSALECDSHCRLGTRTKVFKFAECSLVLVDTADELFRRHVPCLDSVAR